ncbi:RsiV family protein [Psychrobacter sp. I-STPA10]|uniref:RsiV family protein n=1 Tax=Psychrobacter sp. I-STPA10 TaxID=2585769 RepID=UPI001E465CCF|nr:RsiV family protein [Psychrobacter sp. I-STPA10]
MFSKIITHQKTTSQSAIKRLLMVATLTITAGLTISACAQPTTTASSSKNNSFLNGIDYLDYQIPKKVTDSCYQLDNCPTIDVRYLDSNQTWINTIINQQIDKITIGSASSFIENLPKNLTVKQALDAFIADQPEDTTLAYSLEVSPDYMGHINDFELLAIDSYIYTGGAHGMPYRENFIFDSKTQQQLTLDNILLANQKKQFEKLAYNAYKQWVKDNIEQDVQSYEQSWKFFLSDNITFTDKGIELLYQPYDIAAYAYGMPTLSISYEQLSGIIDPRYIPNSK